MGGSGSHSRGNDGKLVFYFRHWVWRHDHLILILSFIRVGCILDLFPAFASPRMGLVVDTRYMLEVEMGIDLRGGDIGVTE